MARLLPFVQAAFRVRSPLSLFNLLLIFLSQYPCFIGSEANFGGDNSLMSPAETVTSNVHGVYPPDGPSPEDVPYFGDQMCECRPPPISLFAILNYFVRADLTPLEIPPHLPLNRVCAIASQRVGPTREDMQYFLIIVIPSLHPPIRNEIMVGYALQVSPLTCLATSPDDGKAQ